MLLSYIRRYGLVICAVGYTLALAALHALRRFPAPGPYDLCRLAGSPVALLQGRVVDFPQTRWGRTRFLLEGSAQPLEAFRGRTLVTLSFPLDDLAPDERVRVRGWLGRPKPSGPRRSFDEAAYLAGQRAFTVLKVWSPNAVRRLDPPGRYRWSQKAWAFHQRFKTFWFDRLPPDEAALLCGMTMGTRGILSRELKNECIRAGVYHILVVSGQNMALIIAFGVAFLGLMRVPRRWTIWVCALPILFYTQAVGADPPVLRAAVMAILTLSAIALGRDTPVYIPFALAWLWILIREPEALFGASFQLSFSATASLLACLPWVRKLGTIPSRVLRWGAEAAVLSLAVHAGVGPILAYYFHQVSIIGFLANLTVFPISGAFMVAGLALGTWGVFQPEGVPQVLIQGMAIALKGLRDAIHWVSHWSWSAVPLPAPSLTVCVIYYALLICILWKLHHGKK